MKKFLSVLICVTLLLSCLSGVSFAAETSEFTIDSLEQYVVYEAVIENDGYIGIPVGAKTYIKGDTTSDTPLIIYVVNTNTERVGMDSDEKILTDLLDRGYAVIVLDYYGNEKAIYPDLDWSLNRIKTSIRTTSGMKKYLAENSASSTYVYILPAGYNVSRQVNYWSLDKHGSDGALEFIISVWNSDFLGVWGEKGVITFEEDTKIIKGAGESEYLEFTSGQQITVKEYTAMLTGGKVTDISQCIKRNGKPITMDLFMDIMYPASPEKEVPVLMYAQSGQNTVGTWNTETRPHMTGFLLRGYAGVLFDYPYVPMSRADNWGYYDGDGEGSVGGVTGDNYTYSLGTPNGVKAETAAVRRVRWLADRYPETYKFDADKYGAVGISKSGPAIRLGHPDPESLPEIRILEDQNGLTRYENGKTEDILDINGNVLVHGGEPQPWLTYKGGSKIPSNVQFTSTTVGSGQYSVVDGEAPMYIYGTIQDGGSQWGYYPDVLSRCYTHDVPTMYYEGLETGHALCIGTDAETGNDAYEALFTTADYWLHDTGAKCEYVKPLNGATYVKATEDIIVKFNGSVPEEEISKIKITNAANGEVVHGVWKDSYGDTEWTFTPYDLKGGNTYTVYVPKSIVGTNGKNIVAAKSSSFTVEPEKLAEATKHSTNMTATSENGVYFEVEGADIESSTSTSVRFGVKNDAANNVLVYSADENGNADALLGKVNLDGAGEYDLDVTDYVKSLADGEKAAFVLKAEKQAGENVVYSMDFEGLTSIPKTVTVSTDVIYELSDEKNATDGGNASYKVAGVKTYDRYRPYHAYYAVHNNVASFYPLGNSLSDDDYGRKFNVKLKLYDTTSRLVQMAVGSAAQKPILDGTAIKYSYRTEADKWNEYSFDYRVEGDLFKTRRFVNVTAESHGADSANKPLYADDFVLTEYITDVEIAAETDSVYASPSLVLHPADKKSVNILKAGYVESGINADVSFEEEQTLLVSGRSKAMSLAGDKKVVAKVDLSAFDDAKANNVVLSVTSGRCDVEVYGIKEETNVTDANYINTAGNDRFSSGVDLSKVYGAKPVAEVKINGEGQYSIDITDYARHMKDLGKTYGYLIFVSKTEASPVVYYEDFNDGDFDATANIGGEIREYIVDDAGDIDSNGYGYKMVSKASYDRIYFDIMDSASWTEEDIGRSFEISYWFKSDAAGTFSNRFQKYRENTGCQEVTHEYTTPNEWQKITYNFVYDQNAHDNAYNRFGFRFNGMPSNTMYIDNLQIRETGIGNVLFEFAQVEDNAVKFNFEGCASTYISKTATSAGNGVISSGNATITAGATTAALNTDAAYNHTKGGSNSFKMSAKKKYHRAFLFNWTTPKAVDEEGNPLTTFAAEDIGRSFEINFWLRSDKTGSFHVSMSNPDQGSVGTASTTQSQVAIYTVDEADTWQNYKYSFTVDENMITNSYVVPRIVPSNLDQTDTEPVTIYIDDIAVREIEKSDQTVSSFVYENDFSTSTGFTNNGFEKKELENGSTTSRVKRVANVNRDENASSKGAVEIMTDKLYNRFYLTDVIESLTEGDEYTISFWMKSDTADTMKVCMSEASLKGSAYSGEIKHSITVSEEDIGVWKKYYFDIKIDKAMIDAGANQLFLTVGNFTNDSTREAIIYIDDLRSVKKVPGEYTHLNVDEFKTISSGALSDAEMEAGSLLKTSENGAAAGIRKAYIAFEGSEDYKNVQKATLNIDVAEANGQIIKVYGLINSVFPDELTYNNAPANNADETINENLAYGKAVLLQTEAKPGIYSIDVTDYIKEIAPADPIFVIVSENVGGTQYIALDFETFALTNGIDYVAESDISITDGKAKVAGNKIVLMNIFGNCNERVKAGEVYEIEFDVVSDSDANIIAGAAKADGEMVGDVANVSALAGAEQNVKFSYTATEEDEQAGVCAVAVESNTNGFSIDNLKVSSTTAVVINKNAELMVEVAKDAEIGEFDEVVVNVTVVSGNNVEINGENKGDTTTSRTYRGNTLDMVAEGDGVFMYWIDADSNTILSYDENFSYTVGSDRNIAAVYADKADVFVTFTSMANKVVASGIVSSITVPADPYVYGYQFNGWYIGAEKQSIVAGDGITAEENTEYKAGFVKDNTAYSVNVNGEVSEHTYNEKVTLTADAENFSYWKRDGVIVSYNTEYSFYVNGDTTVEAVYGESVSGGVVLAMANPVLVGTDKIAFFAERDVPTDCEMIETGILMGTSSGLDIDNATIKAVAKSNTNKGQFTVRKANVKAGDIYYGVAYVIYRDANGNVNTAYSNEVSYTVK